MIPETENPQEAKGVYPGKPARLSQADPGRYFTQSPQCWFSREIALICLVGYKNTDVSESQHTQIITRVFTVQQTCHKDMDGPPTCHKDMDGPPNCHTNMDGPPTCHKDIDGPPTCHKDMDDPPSCHKDIDEYSDKESQT